MGCQVGYFLPATESVYEVIRAAKPVLERRTFLQSAPAVAGASLQVPSRPNILWICTDQQRWDTLGVFGNQQIRTPNLDRLAKQGVAFSRAYSQSPICTPSRASFMTGLYPSSVHVHRNGNSHFPVETTPRLISRLLADGGYDCGLVGKLHLSSTWQRVEPRIPDGFRRFEWSHHPRSEPFWPVESHAYQRWLRDQGASWDKLYKVKKISGYPDPYQAGMPERYHEVTWGAGETIAAIRGGLRKPWFQCMHVFAPHPPFDPAPEYLERMKPADFADPLYRPGEEVTQERYSRIDHQTRKPVAPNTYQARHMKAAYAAMVEHIDHEVGRILETLETTGQRANTIVVFFSDHGEMLGDHCLRQKGCRFYEGAVRIPLLISWPGRFRENLISRELVELTDIVPTLLDTLGIAAPSTMNGRSLVPVLTGTSNGARHRDFVRAEYHDTLELPDKTHATMLRDERYKLVIYHGHQLGELYDLREDPSEFHNLFDDPRGQQPRKRLTEAMLDQLALTTDIGQPRIGKF